MSTGNVPPCGVCGQEGSREDDGVVLCREHAAVAYRLGELKKAQTEGGVDLTGKRSHAPRDSYDGGYRRPFDIVPDDSVERVNRDVTATFENVPLWAVQALFDRVHKELGQPDIEGVEAQLIVKYSNMDEKEYTQLIDLRDTFTWTSEVVVDVTKTRIYAPRNLAEQRLKVVEEERERGAA